MKMFPSQLQFISELIGVLAGSGSKLIVLVSGLTGVGKTTVIKAAGRQIAELANTSVVDGERFVKMKCRPDRNYVVPAMRSDADSIRKNYQSKYPDYQLVEMTLKGLEKSEMREYLEGQEFSAGAVTLATEVSLGVPLVASRIAQACMLNRSLAVGMIRECLSRTIYLRGLKDDEVMSKLLGYVRYTLPESDVPALKADPHFSCSALMTMAALRRIDQRQPELFLPPAFTTASSEQIYDRLLSMPIKEMKRDSVMLFVPNVTPKLAEWLMDETGTNYWADRFNTRLHAMFAEVRKGDANLLKQDEDFDKDYPGDDAYGECLKFSTVRPILQKDDYPVVGIYTRDHRECSGSVLLGTIGLETHFQQAGIRYFVEYGYTGEVYRFDPPDAMVKI